MPNKKYAKEWLNLAEKNLETARLLIKERHYTDIIGIEIQQAVEKTMKAVYGFYNVKIPRTHNLSVLYDFVTQYLDLEEINIDDLIIISDYYDVNRYPGPKYNIPDFDEIEHSISVAEKIYSRIINYINA